jgi:hypothetical protein
VSHNRMICLLWRHGDGADGYFNRISLVRGLVPSIMPFCLFY